MSVEKSRVKLYRKLLFKHYLCNRYNLPNDAELDAVRSLWQCVTTSQANHLTPRQRVLRNKIARLRIRHLIMLGRDVGKLIRELWAT